MIKLLIVVTIFSTMIVHIWANDQLRIHQIIGAGAAGKAVTVATQRDEFYLFQIADFPYKMQSKVLCNPSFAVCNPSFESHMSHIALAVCHEQSTFARLSFPGRC